MLTPLEKNLPTENIKTIKSLVKKTINEIRLPLGAISAGTDAMERSFEILLEGYLLAQDAGLPIKKLRPQQLKLIPNALAAIKEDNQLAFRLSDYLLNQLHEIEINKKPPQQVSASICIKEALLLYPFERIEDEKLITFNSKNNFCFSGNKAYFLNLLFFIIQQNSKTKIVITLENHEKENCINIEIMDATINKKIIDLSFGELVMKSVGGKLIRTIQKNKSMTLKLVFPI